MGDVGREQTGQWWRWWWQWGQQMPYQDGVAFLLVFLSYSTQIPIAQFERLGIITSSLVHNRGQISAPKFEPEPDQDSWTSQLTSPSTSIPRERTGCPPHVLVCPVTNYPFHCVSSTEELTSPSILTFLYYFALKVDLTDLSNENICCNYIP